MSKKTLGKQGEDLAEKFLKEKDYQILEKNFHKRTGEIDIIAFDPHFREYVFVEVKTRKNLSYGYPEESVDEKKLEKITETAERWLMEKNRGDWEWRIDIIAIEDAKGKPIINHIKNIS